MLKRLCSVDSYTSKTLDLDHSCVVSFVCSFLYGMTSDDVAVVQFDKYGEYFYRQLDVSHLSLSDVIQMIKTEHSKVYPGLNATVVLAIDETALVADSLRSMGTLTSYISQALSHFDKKNFACIFSALTPTMIENAVPSTGRPIHYVSLPLLTEEQIAIAVFDIEESLTPEERAVMWQLIRFTAGHPRSIEHIVCIIKARKSENLSINFADCCAMACFYFKLDEPDILDVYIDALRGFQVSADKRYDVGSLQYLYENGYIFSHLEGNERIIRVSPFRLLKFATQILGGEFLNYNTGFILVCQLIKGLIQSTVDHPKALEQRCLLMTLLTMLLIKHDEEFSVFDLFVRDLPFVYTSNDFNFDTVVASLSAKDFVGHPWRLNFSECAPILDMKFEDLTTEEFYDRFPARMVTGALMQAGQIAVDSIIYDSRNIDKPYAIFFENKFSLASTEAPYLMAAEMKDKYNHFSKTIAPKLIGA